MRRLGLLLFFLISLPCFGTNWYVWKSSTGTHNGTSWTNAWTDISSITGYACGDTIWIGGGTYTTNATITKTCTSGTILTIESVLSTDATPTSAPGYTTAVLNQVVMSNNFMDFNGAYITLSGRTGVPGSSSSYGISFQCPSGNSCGPVTVGASAAANNITLSYLEMFGPPCVTSGGSGAGSCTGDTHAVDHGTGTTTNLLIDHCWLHRFAEIVRPYQWTGYTIQYTDLDTTRQTPDEHEDIMYAANPSSGTMRYNIIWGSPNDGIFFDFGGNSLTYYGNVYYNSGGAFITFKSGFTNGTFLAYNNTFSSDTSFGDFICPSNCPWVDITGTPSTMTVKNNIFDHVGIDGTLGANGNFNAYSTDIGTQDTGASSFTYTSAFAPSNTQFITTSTSNPISANYRLTTTGQTAFGGKGTNLGSPYNVDMDGNTQPTTWNVGAYNFSTGCTFSPPAGTYTGTQTVSVTCPAGLTAFYTTDGSTPSVAGFQYSSPFTVASSQTIKVIAASVGVTSRNVGSTSTGWKCVTNAGTDYSPPAYQNCQAGGGVGSIEPSSISWTFGSPMVETTSTTSSTGTTQILYVQGTTSTACPNCTGLVQDKVFQVDKGKTFLLNNELDSNVNMLATWNQFHTASLQCNQQGATPQWQYDNQQGSWQNFSPAITYGCPISTTQQTEIRYGIHWTNGDTSCTGGFSTDHYDFLTICLGGTNGQGGACQDFTINKTLCGYTEPSFSQKMILQDQPDLTNTTTSGSNPTTATRQVWNDNATLYNYGTQVTASATYNIGGGPPVGNTKIQGAVKFSGSVKVQ